MTEVTREYRVDEYDNVYDESGNFFCKWFVLTDEEKSIVKRNPASAK